MGLCDLIAYYTLLNQPELPPLIAIEEPERKSTSGCLKRYRRYILEQLCRTDTGHCHNP